MKVLWNDWQHLELEAGAAAVGDAHHHTTATGYLTHRIIIKKAFKTIINTCRAKCTFSNKNNHIQWQFHGFQRNKREKSRDKPEHWSLQSSHHQQTRSDRDISIDCQHFSCLQQMFDLSQHMSAKAFSVSAPAAWNSLSFNCRSCKLFSTFASMLKTELFDTAYYST